MTNSAGSAQAPALAASSPPARPGAATAASRLCRAACGKAGPAETQSPAAGAGVGRGREAPGAPRWEVSCCPLTRWFWGWKSLTCRAPGGARPPGELLLLIRNGWLLRHVTGLGVASGASCRPGPHRGGPEGPSWPLHGAEQRCSGCGAGSPTAGAPQPRGAARVWVCLRENEADLGGGRLESAVLPRWVGWKPGGELGGRASWGCTLGSRLLSPCSSAP